MGISIWLDSPGKPGRKLLPEFQKISCLASLEFKFPAPWVTNQIEIPI